MKINDMSSTPYQYLLYSITPGEPVPDEILTHSHLSWSSIIPYLLPPSIMIHGIHPVQFTWLTVSFTLFKKTWREIVEKDCQARKLNKEDAMNRNK